MKHHQETSLPHDVQDVGGIVDRVEALTTAAMLNHMNPPADDGLAHPDGLSTTFGRELMFDTLHSAGAALHDIVAAHLEQREDDTYDTGYESDGTGLGL